MDASHPEPYQQYWYKLGKFIHDFSGTEAALLVLLRQIAGVTKEVAGVLFSGTRSDAAKDLINGILETYGKKEQKERLARPFEQFGTINTIRNHAVHWGANLVSNEMIISNNHLSPRPSKAKQFIITAADFDKICADLFVIRIFFDREIFPRLPVWKELPQEIFERPWRYKPPQQPLPKKEPRVHHPKRSRQPPSSY